LLLHLGKLDIQEGRPVQAEKWLRHAMEVDPSDAEAQFMLANSLQLQGRTRQAAAARALYKRNNSVLEQANKLLKSEAEHPTNDPPAPWKIGRLLLRIGQDRAGLHWLEEALHRDRAHRPTHQELAEYYESKGKRELAEVHRRMLRQPALPTQIP